MKLLYCGGCGDVFNLTKDTAKACTCGSTVGFYHDEKVAYYNGKHAIPLGFSNRSFLQAIMDAEYDTSLANTISKSFDAFVVPKNVPEFIKQKDPVTEPTTSLT